jgi:hypothetical protein
MALYRFMNWVDFKYSLNTASEVNGPERTTTTIAAIIALLTLIACASDLHPVYSTTQEELTGTGTEATTSCLGAGPISESEAEARLLSNSNNITQQCEQTISSEDGNGSKSKNYATNEVIVDDERTEEDSNQVSQQSKQKIDN